MLFEEYSVKEFIADLASSSPSPGGGSSAALISALAGSLNSMVYSLTVGKKSFDKLSDDNKERMLKLKDECESFIKRSMELMEEDRSSFTDLMDAYKLPKESEEEIKVRKDVIKEKTYYAMMSPLNLAREALRFYNNIKFAVEYGNKMLVSDAGVAAIFLNAAIESAIINVKINLSSLEKEDYFDEIKKELISIEEESLKNKVEIMKEVNKSI